MPSYPGDLWRFRAYIIQKFWEGYITVQKNILVRGGNKCGIVLTRIQILIVLVPIFKLILKIRRQISRAIDYRPSFLVYIVLPTEFIEKTSCTVVEIKFIHFRKLVWESLFFSCSYCWFNNFSRLSATKRDMSVLSTCKVAMASLNLRWRFRVVELTRAVLCVVRRFAEIDCLVWINILDKTE